jgi:uncharacterized protein (TIGR04255 family)
MSEFSLTNPPLICVAARVQFMPVESMANFIPALQEALRLNGYPVTVDPIKTKNWRIDEVPGSGMNVAFQEFDRWDFSNVEKTVIIRLDKLSVSILFTAYDHFALAEPHYRNIFSMVESVIPSLLPQLYQLRYVGYIPCEVESDPSEWVTPSVLGMPNLGELQRINSISETSFETPEGGRLVTRCISLGPKHIILPPDLLPINASLRYPLESEVPFLLLENLHTQAAPPAPFTAESCLAQLSALRRHNAEVFQATITTKALELWK